MFVFVESIPHPGCQWQMKVYIGWDPLLKMECHPGGDWHPVRGVDPKYVYRDSWSGCVMVYQIGEIL